LQVCFYSPQCWTDLSLVFVAIGRYANIFSRINIFR
jgi:hypothetical protein